MNATSNEDRKTLILTGASRGIGHAAVKRFSSAGWRVITCSRHGFPENCPWEAGPEDHIQIDLANPDNVEDGIAEMRSWIEEDADFRADLWWLAMDRDEVAGVCLGWPALGEMRHVGVIDELAARRPWRRQGLATLCHGSTYFSN